MAVWIKAAEAMALLGIQSDRHLRRIYSKLHSKPGAKQANGKYERLIALSSMPERAQARYWLAKGEGVEKGTEAQRHKGMEESYQLSVISCQKEAEQAEARSKTEALLSMPEYNRKIAFERIGIIDKWESYYSRRAAERAEKKTEIMNAFVKAYNTINTEKLSSKTLYRWLKEYKEKGLAGLAGNYGKNAGAGALSEWCDEARELFEALYLQESKPAVQTCYDVMRQHSILKGLKIPDINVVYRYANELPRDLLILGREGKKAYSDKVLPYILRDPESIESNSVFVSDHHQFDNIVLWWDDKPVRVWVTVWVDMRSWKIVGRAISLIPSSHSILCALKDAIVKHGKPGWVYTDNGKDYKARVLTAGTFCKNKYNEEIQMILGVYKQLGIKTIYAIPYNAKAKIAERVFRNLTISFSKMVQGYTGRNVANRPESLKDDVKDKNLLHISEFIKLFDEYVENNYNKKASEGRYLEGRCPAEVYEEKLKERKVIEPESLNLLMMPVADRRPKTVRNGMIYINELKEYYKMPLTVNHGEKVIARYDDSDINKIYLWSEKIEFLGIGDIVKAAPIVDAPAEIFESLNQNKKERSTPFKAILKQHKNILNKLTSEERIKQVDDKIIDVKTGVNVAQMTRYDGLKEQVAAAEMERKENAEEIKKYLSGSIDIDTEAYEPENELEMAKQYLLG